MVNRKIIAVGCSPQERQGLWRDYVSRREQHRRPVPPAQREAEARTDFPTFDIDTFLRERVRLATGCTEPGAVAYAVSVAVHAAMGRFPTKADGGRVLFDTAEVEASEVIGQLQHVRIKVDRDTLKNATNVFIPGTEFQQGIPIAAAMGAFCHPRQGLNLFDVLPEGTLTDARSILDRIELDDHIDENPIPEIKIEVELKFGGKNVYVRLQHDHTFIEKIAVDGTSVYDNVFAPAGGASRLRLPKTIDEVFHVVTQLTATQEQQLWEGLERNYAIALAGLHTPYGDGEGITAMQREFPCEWEKIVTDPSRIFSLRRMDVFRLARIMTAAAVDARMGGAQLPVTSTSGSGNQGIAATMPLLVIYHALNWRGPRGGHSPAGLRLIKLLERPYEYNIDRRRLCEAALFSHLIAAIATDEIGAIGAWCGCGAKAGLAAAAAVAYLLGGNAAQVHQAINLIATESPGMLCDGAKPGCANKLGNARAVRRGVDAVRGHTTSDFNGIIFPDAMDTIRALGEICRTTAPTDVVIAKIIHGKWGRS